MKKNKFLIVLIASYVVAALGSFAIFSFVFGDLGKTVTSPVPDAKQVDGRTLFDESLPKTEACPLSGAKYSKQQRQWWEDHRPLGVMIENHEDSRPQSGLSSADIVYEAVAEGGITRFLAVFYCQDAEYVGPVRSARTYFLDFLSEYGDYPLYAHVGGANCNAQTGSGCQNGARADAIGQIMKYGWFNYSDMDGSKNVGFPTMYRDYDRLGRTVATEHTMYSSTTKLWEYAEKERGLTNVDEDGNSWDEDFTFYTFKEDANASSRPASQVITYNAWDGYGDYEVVWTYSKASNTYLRENGGAPHVDLNTGEQLSAKNIVVLFMRESSANDGYDNNLHLLYGTTGKGDAIVFQDGKEIEANWSKSNRTAHLVLTDNRGQEIELNPGLTWFSVLPLDTDIEIK